MAGIGDPSSSASHGCAAACWAVLVVEGEIVGGVVYEFAGDEVDVSVEEEDVAAEATVGGEGAGVAGVVVFLLLGEVVADG